MATSPLPLTIPPGIVKVDSPNGAEGRYTDSDKIRFIAGKVEKWDGWESFSSTVLTGVPRGCVAWFNSGGNPNIAFGTHLKLYAILSDGTVSDITPIRDSGTLGANPFSMTNGSAAVTVTDTAHGVDIGDYVTFSGASAAGGITINGTYTVTSKTDADHYVITHTSNATSTTTGGGAAVAYSYEITIGYSSSVAGLGWGAGTWGSGTWGTVRSSGIVINLRVWSLAEYGNDLLASPTKGGLYYWQEATDANAEIVTNAPTSIRAMFVTGERYIFALGTSGPMVVQWPDVDNMTDWTPSASNTANTRTLQVGSKLIAGMALSELLNLVWSDSGLYLFQYTGQDEVYADRLIGSGCGLVGQLAFTKAAGVAYWFTGATFMMYAGQGVQEIPHVVDILDWVLDNLNVAHREKIWCVFDEHNQQVRWGFPSGTSTEPDRYVDVTVNGEFVWTVGTLDRTTGCIYRPSQPEIIMADSDGNLFTHNVGLDDDGAAMEAYITYGLYALSNGDVNVDVMGIIPDCQRQVGDLTFDVTTYDRPQDATAFDSGSTVLDEVDTIADIRISGRHFTMTVTSDEVGGDFRLGIIKLEVGSGGNRR
jgi:hypothetical protein